jgi:hypothetical protein
MNVRALLYSLGQYPFRFVSAFNVMQKDLYIFCLDFFNVESPVFVCDQHGLIVPPSPNRRIVGG